MNLDQFRAMLTLCDGIEGRTVLPVPDPSAERIFGGQTMAQLIVAAAPPGSAKAVKSLQIAFPRAGRAAGPLHLDLEQTHDGRSLGHRRAVAWASQRDADVSVQTGVVTHSVWFHQPLDVARWLRADPWRAIGWWPRLRHRRRLHRIRNSCRIVRAGKRRADPTDRNAAMTAQHFVRYEVDDRVAVITLDRPGPPMPKPGNPQGSRRSLAACRRGTRGSGHRFPDHR